MTDDYTQAEVVRTLKRLEDGQGRTETKLDNLIAGFVPRGEYEVGRAAMGREIGEVKASVTEVRADVEKVQTDVNKRFEAKQVPWTAVGSFVIAGVALALALIQAVGR